MTFAPGYAPTDQHRARLSEAQRRYLSDPAKAEARAAHMRRVRAEWVRDHPDEAREAFSRGARKSVRQIPWQTMHDNGVRVNKQLWVCLRCGLTSTPMGVGKHQACRGHDGKAFVCYRSDLWDDDLTIEPPMEAA